MEQKKHVKCLDNEKGDYFLTVGKVYEVLGEEPGWYNVMNDEGWTSCYEQLKFEIVEDEFKETPITNKYSREIVKGVFVDVYDVLRAFNVTDPCLQHLLKKALAAGQRGHKSATEDYEDILASAKRALEMHLAWKEE